jgi:hypothetical protein
VQLPPNVVSVAKVTPVVKIKVCIDCVPGSKRPCPNPGPRCATHWREEKRRRKEARKSTYQEKTYGITLEEKRAVIAFQGGGCICAPWTGYTGKSRELSTDHDHETLVIRGVLCKHCNDHLGMVRDSIEYFERMIAYLKNPPAVQVLGERIAPE